MNNISFLTPRTALDSLCSLGWWPLSMGSVGRYFIDNHPGFSHRGTNYGCYLQIPPERKVVWLVGTALIKLCQLKALLLFFPGRFEIQNSPLLSLSLSSPGSGRRPTLSLFDQAIFNLSLKSLPLSPPPPPPRSAADIGLNYTLMPRKSVKLGRY